MNFKKILIFIFVIFSLIFLMNGYMFAFSSHVGKQNEVSTITNVNFKQDRSSMQGEIFTSTSGAGNPLNSSDTNDSGNSSNNDGGMDNNNSSDNNNGYDGPMCFKVNKMSSVQILAERIYHHLIEQNGLNDTPEFALEYFTELEQNLNNEEFVKEFEKQITNTDFGFGDASFRMNITNILGDSSWLKDAISYVNGSLSEEEFSEFQSGNAYLIYPNPNAEWGVDEYCGIQPVGATVFITNKHIAGEPLDADIFHSALNSSVSIQLNQIDDYRYKADVHLNTQGLAPLRINNITWVWTLRVPDNDNPLSNTQTLMEAGKSYEQPASVKRFTTFNLNVGGNLGNQSVNDIQNEFCEAFNKAHNNPDSSCENGTVIISPSYNLYQSETEKKIEALMGTDTGKEFIGEHDVKAMNIAKVAQNTNTSDTFDLSSYLDGSGGKYVLAVSAIVNGEYEFNTGNGYLTMDIPIGFVSAASGDTQFSCSQIMSELDRLKNKDLTEGDNFKLFSQFGNATCEQVEWKGPEAVAMVNSMPNNQVELDGTYSTGTTKITTTYVFNGNIQDKEECELIDGEEVCETKTYFTGYNYDTVETTEHFPIEYYIWEEKGRVINTQTGQYEIELSSEVFKDPKIIGKLNNGTTFACLRVQTTAPQANMSTNRYPKDRDTYTKLKGIDEIKSKNIAHCDYIRSIEADRIIHENWGQ